MSSAKSILNQLLGDTPPATLPADLIPTDRILQRWAVSIGLGLPTEAWDDARISRPPPLPDDLAIVVDQLVLKSPPRTKALIVAWYKTPVPTPQVAEDQGMSLRSFYRAWHLSLHFMRHRFQESRSAALLKILAHSDIPSVEIGVLSLLRL